MWCFSIHPADAFLPIRLAAHFKGRDPTGPPPPLDALKANWLEGGPAVYIGDRGGDLRTA